KKPKPCGWPLWIIHKPNSFQGVGAFGALRASRAALARHLHRQEERGSINLLRKQEAARNISLETGSDGELISVINTD
ncbi:hypothetical protein, partial [Komagataeibacter europaeus]|uniref:hypothetical protein n=1 Tax=Komagataeibacter europaeus TaxID=33995 RepID=UPI0005B292E5